MIKPRLAGWMINWCRGGYQPPVITVKNICDEMIKLAPLSGVNDKVIKCWNGKTT